MTERSTTSWVDRLTQEPWVYRTGVAVRLAAVVVGVLVSAAQGVLADSWNLALLLGALALIVGLKGIRWGGSAPWWALLELTVAGVFLGIEAPFNPYFLGYLLAAGATAGVVYGIAIGLSGLVASGLGLTLMAWLVGGGLTGSELLVVGQWYLIAALGVLAAGWSRVLIRRRRRVDDRYQAAYQLLVRLREVTRSLPTALDDVTAATTMLDLIGRSVPFDQAAVLRIDDHGPPQPLTVAGGDAIPWYPNSESWLMRRVDETGAAAQSMVWLAQSTTDPSAHRTFRAIVPVDVGRTRIGLVTLQRNTPWTDEQLAEASDIVERSALMLDTAFVFGDVRSMATTEERRRLAREIHDGIAQEIAGLAYVVDDVAHREKDPQLQQDLSSIREDLTRLVSELRLSIFELRSGIDPGLGLGSSLSTYVRQIGTRGGLTVHLVLEEDATRLPADIEVEIMRIVQEAITNARRHSRAKNLWVTLRTSPPRALVRVADDGVGLRGKRGDSYGLEIMRERAARIGGRLDVRQRVGGGTVVDLSVGDFTAPAATIAEPGIDDTLHMQRGATA